MTFHLGLYYKNALRIRSNNLMTVSIIGCTYMSKYLIDKLDAIIKKTIISYC